MLSQNTQRHLRAVITPDPSFLLPPILFRLHLLFFPSLPRGSNNCPARRSTHNGTAPSTKMPSFAPHLPYWEGTRSSPLFSLVLLFLACAVVSPCYRYRQAGFAVLTQSCGRRSLWFGWIKGPRKGQQAADSLWTFRTVSSSRFFFLRTQSYLLSFVSCTYITFSSGCILPWRRDPVGKHLWQTRRYKQTPCDLRSSQSSPSSCLWRF